MKMMRNVVFGLLALLMVGLSIADPIQWFAGMELSESEVASLTSGEINDLLQNHQVVVGDNVTDTGIVCSYQIPTIRNERVRVVSGEGENFSVSYYDTYKVVMLLHHSYIDRRAVELCILQDDCSYNYIINDAEVVRVHYQDEELWVATCKNQKNEAVSLVQSDLEDLVAELNEVDLQSFLDGGEPTI